MSAGRLMDPCGSALLHPGLISRRPFGSLCELLWFRHHHTRSGGIRWRSGFLFSGGKGLDPLILRVAFFTLPQFHTTFVMSHNVWELNPIPERSDQKATYHLAVPDCPSKSALAVASSLVAGPALVLSSVFGITVGKEALRNAVNRFPRLWATTLVRCARADKSRAG